MFISAASKQMDALKDKSLIIEDTRRNLLGNRLTLVIPKDSHKPILYPSAVLKGSKSADAAKDFINYLYSEKAKQVFERYGFSFIAK